MLHYLCLNNPAFVVKELYLRVSIAHSSVKETSHYIIISFIFTLF